MRRWYLITSLFLLACSSGCKTSVTPVGSGTAEPRRNAQAPQSSSDIASTDWRITGFVTQCDGDDYEFANVDRDHPPDHSINNQPVSSRLAMVLEQPISTGEAMAFETKDDPEQTNGFQGLLGTECDTPTPVKAAGAPNKDQLGDFSIYIPAGCFSGDTGQAVEPSWSEPTRRTRITRCGSSRRRALIQSGTRYGCTQRIRFIPLMYGAAYSPPRSRRRRISS